MEFCDRRSKVPFTDRKISSLKPKKEPGRTGLGVRISPKGAKTWTYVYRLQRRIALGSYPAMSLSKAHRALADAKDKLRDGIDSETIATEAKEAERNAETMADMAAEYIERHAKPNMKASPASEDERILNREILPYIGKIKAQDVTRRDLIVLLDWIADRGACVLRNRVAGVLSRFFLFGLDRGVILASPALASAALRKGRAIASCQ